VLFKRRRKGRHAKAGRLISDLFAAAISEALVVLLADASQQGSVSLFC
jgi:hypothetical protein